MRCSDDEFDLGMMNDDELGNGGAVIVGAN